MSRLDAFIKREAARPTDELPFDLDTAIRVCRQAGYFEHASYLAKKYERHEDYLRIQIEDASNYGDALTYLRRLGTEAVGPSARLEVMYSHSVSIGGSQSSAIRSRHAEQPSRGDNPAPHRYLH